jgi:all-trans-8'-apo-beta-carotenal 15,15'-oxygenase
MTITTEPPLLADWARGYQSQPTEYADLIDRIEGVIPPELHGTLFRNGPGLLDVGGVPLHHPFDGDGLVSAFRFSAGQARAQSRYVRTEGYLAEQAAGRILYRGVFGTQRPGGWLANAFDLGLKNIANTNVVYWGGRLLALWEAAEPHRIDPATLATLGLDRLDGALQPGDPFAAHLHIDPFCHWDGGAPCLVNFATRPGLNTTLQIFEFAPDFRVRRRQELELNGFAFIHDMAITPNYCIFFQNPMRYDALPYALGLRSAAQGLVSQPDRPTRIHVVPRHPSLGEPRTFTGPPGFVWHHANAFEEGDQLVIDSVWYDSYYGIAPGQDFRQIDFAALPPGRLARTRLDPATGSVDRTFIAERCCEFPVLHPAHVGRAYRYVYLAAGDPPVGNWPQQTIWKVDMATGAQQIWSAAPRGFVGEPIFVPRPRSAAVADSVTPDVGDPQRNAAPGEDNGWLLALVYDAERHTSALVILDAQDLGRGPLAQIRLKGHLPHGLHGSFTSAVFGGK